MTDMPTLTKPHFVVDASFYSSKEVLSIPRRYRHQAVGAWTMAGAWSAEKQTDGRVPGNALQELGITPLMVDLLVEATLWEIEGGTVHATDARRARAAHTTVVQFRNWPKWQKTKAEWEAGRAANARRQAAHRKRSKGDNGGDVSRVSNALQTVGAVIGSNIDEAPRNALVTRQERKELKNLGKGLSSGDAPNGTAPLPDFPDHCTAHRHVEHPPPCGACRTTREQNQAAAKQAADVEAVKRADAHQREMQRRRDCWECDDFNGMVTVYDDDGNEIGLRRCTHPEVP